MNPYFDNGYRIAERFTLSDEDYSSQQLKAFNDKGDCTVQYRCGGK